MIFFLHCNVVTCQQNISACEGLWVEQYLNVIDFSCYKICHSIWIIIKKYLETSIELSKGK